MFEEVASGEASGNAVTERTKIAERRLRTLRSGSVATAYTQSLLSAFSQAVCGLHPHLLSIVCTRVYTALAASAPI